MTRVRQLLRTGTLTIGWLIVLPILVTLWAAILPVVPWLRIAAADLVPNAAPWCVVAAAAALLLAAVVHRCRATRASRWLGIAAGFAVVTATGIVAHFLILAHRNGIAVDLLATLSPRHIDEAAAPDETHVYARPQGEPLSLDIYRPPTALRHGPSPLFVTVHGGGFIEGTRRAGAANLRLYASRGWTVVSVDYRLATPARPTWNLAIEDVRCALGWIAARAKRLDVDLGRLTLNGISAGGHLAIATAYATAADRHERACGVPVPRVGTVVAKVPLIDPLASWNRPGEMQPVQRMYMEQYLGGSPARYPARYAARDLIRRVDPRNPPTLILVGRDDPLLPVASAESFARRAAAVGATVRLIAFPYSGHSFNTTYASIPNQIVTGATARFIADHGGGPRSAPRD